MQEDRKYWTDQAGLWLYKEEALQNGLQFFEFSLGNSREPFCLIFC